MKKVLLFVSLVMICAMAQAQEKNEGKKSEATEYMFQFDYHVNNTTGEFLEEQVYVTILDKPGEIPVICTSGVYEGFDEIIDEVDPSVVYWKSKDIIYFFGKRWTYAIAKVDVAGLDKCVLYLMKKDGSSDFSRVNKTDGLGVAFTGEAIETLHQTVRDRSFHHFTVKVQE